MESTNDLDLVIMITSLIGDLIIVTQACLTDEMEQLLIMLCVYPDIILPLFRYIFIPENSFHRASRLTGPAINTFIRMYIKLSSFFKIRFVLARMNAINRTNFDASGIFSADARFTNDVNCHYLSFLETRVK